MSEAMNCVVCGTANRSRRRIVLSEAKTLGKPATLSLAHCRNCGHVYQHPQLAKSYAKIYYDQAYAGLVENAYWDADLKVAHSRQLLHVFREYSDGLRVLETGAGLGLLSTLPKTRELM